MSHLFRPGSDRSVKRFRRTAPGRHKVSAPRFEALEDRTLLSFGNSLQALETTVLNDVGTSIPVVGSQLANFAPVKQLLDNIIAPLNLAVEKPTSRDGLSAAIASALGSLLEGQPDVEGTGPYTVSAHLHEELPISPMGAPVQTTGFGLGGFLTGQVTDSLTYTLYFDYTLRFTVDTAGAAALMDSPSSPMSIVVGATLNNFSAMGTLNDLLSASVTVPANVAPPKFNLVFTIDPLGGGAVPFTLSGSASATLPLALSFGSSDAPINPKLVATLHVGWADSGLDLEGKFTELYIDNVGLDVGALLPDFLTKVIGDIQTYTKPLQPIANFLQAEVPGLDRLGVDLSLEKLAELDGDDGVGEFVKVIDLLNSLPSDGSQGNGGMLKFDGTLQFSGNSIGSILGGGSDSNLIGAVSAATDSASELFSEADAMTEDPGSTSGGFLSDAEGSSDGGDGGGNVGFAFPIVTDPVHTVFQMLEGQDADLITFHASFATGLHGTAGAQFGPFSVFLTGGIDVNLALNLGYDTHGLRKFIANSSDATVLLDGLYFDTGTDKAGNAKTGITVHGDIGVGAAALIVAVEGDLNATASLTLNPNLLKGPDADADPAHNKLYLGSLLDVGSVDTLFAVSGDVNLSLNAEGGLFFGPVHVVVFSVQLASDELIDFSTAIYPGEVNGNPLTDPNTIYIDLTDGNQNIDVYTTAKVTKQIRVDQTDDDYVVETDYTTVVDYGDHQDSYPLGYVADDLVNHTSRYFFDPFDSSNDTAPPPDYNLIAVRPKAGGGEYSGDHTITIEPSAIGGIEVNVSPNGDTPVPDTNTRGNPLKAPLNAVLVGGSGDDTFINSGTGQAVLVGNGGSNVLKGGVLEYGGYVDARPTGGFVAGELPTGFTIPAMVMDELKASQATNDYDFNKYVSLGLPVPGVGADDLVGTLGSDVLIGGPSGNTFEGEGGADHEFGGAGFDTYVVSGSDAADVYIYSSVEDYSQVNGVFDGLFAENRQAQYNGDELDVVYDESASVPTFDPPPPSSGSTAVTIDQAGSGLSDDNIAFPDDKPVEVKTPQATIHASGLAKVDLGGVDVATSSLIAPDGHTGESPYFVSSLSIGNLASTTVHAIEISPSPNGPSCPIFFSGTGRGGDEFEVNSAAIPAEVVTVPTVPNAPTVVPAHVTGAPTTISAHEATRVTLTPGGLSPLILTVDNIRGQDSLTLDGGGGGDTYIVDLNISTTFFTNIQDSSSKGLDTLDIYGSGFVHPLPSRQGIAAVSNNFGAIAALPLPPNTPAALNQYANLGGPVEGGQKVQAAQLQDAVPDAAGPAGLPILLDGSYLGPNPVSFSPSVGVAPTFQESVTYVSPNDIEFENDVEESSIVVQQSLVHVGFNNDVKFLSVGGTQNGNTFDVTGLSALVTSIQGGPQGDVFNVGADSGANRPAAAINLVVSSALLDMVIKDVGAALKAGGTKAAIKKAAISSVDKNAGAAFNLGRNSAILGAINANLGTSLKLGRGNGILGAINSGLGAYLKAVQVAPVFISSPYDKLFLDGAAGKRYGSDVTNVSDFAGAQLTVNGYGSRDVVNLGSDGITGLSGTASLITGPVSVNNRGGLTTLNVDDSADTQVRDVQIRSTAIQGLGPSYVSYAPTELAALNIVGTRGFAPGSFSGRFASPPRDNTYDVLSTPGVNFGSNLVKTTLTVLGAGGDTVSVLAASNKTLGEMGVQGTLQIVSPNHLTDLRIYGYVAPANVAAAGGKAALSLFNATAGKSRTLSKAALNAPVKLFASLHQAAMKGQSAPKVVLKAQRVSHARLKAKRARKAGLAAASKLTSLGAINSHNGRASLTKGSQGAINGNNGKGSSTASSGSFQFPIIIDSDHVSGLTPGDIEYGADQLVSLTVTTPAGGRYVNVVGTPNQGAAGSVVTSLIGHGVDSVYVGDNHGHVSGIQGTLNVANSFARSALTVDGSAEPAKQTVTISSGAISGLAPASITYESSDLSNVSLMGGLGNNTFQIVGTRFRAPAGISIQPRTELPVTIDGGAGANTLIGPDVANTWNVQSPNAGSVGKVTFSLVDSLTGGALADTFAWADGASLDGGLDGGGGENTLDMSAQSRDVTVNLTEGTATAIGGKVAHIANVNGGRGNNLLVGDIKANTLQGGGGRNILIGEGGVDQINGGTLDNILIAGTTSYDLEPTALDAVMAEFDRTDEDFLTRLTHLLSGDGPNGETLLNPTTVASHEKGTVLTGGAGPNWFFVRDGNDQIKAGTLHKDDVVTKL